MEKQVILTFSALN